MGTGKRLIRTDRGDIYTSSRDHNALREATTNPHKIPSTQLSYYEKFVSWNHCLIKPIYSRERPTPRENGADSRSVSFLAGRPGKLLG
jgi:hypothetical protein